LYLDGRCEQLRDGGLQFVGQRQLKDAGFIDESVLNPTSTQQLQRSNALQHDNRQHVTSNGYKDPPVVVTPR